MTPGPEVAAEPHCLDLPGGSWALWRWVVLRGAGFPAATVLALAAPGLADLADHLLDFEQEAADWRRTALAQVDEALDALHQEDGSASRERRTPLLKALYALAGGKLPKVSPTPEIAAAVGHLTKAEQRVAAARQEIGAAYAVAVQGTSREISRLATWAPFRAAVTWQTRHAAEISLAEVARPADRRDSRRRQHEELVASYLQRYCTKNDTIGFFGPVGWARLASEGPLVTVRPGPELIAERAVYFEHWGLDALARRLSEDSSLRPWMAPRLRTGFAYAPGELRGTAGQVIPLAPEQHLVLAACDGVRTARSIAGELAARAAVAPGAPQIPPDRTLAVLDQLSRAGVVTWTFEVPLELRPEQTLRSALAKIDDPGLRSQALGPLDELEERRRRIATADEPTTLGQRLRELDETFTRLTGMPPYRNEGQMYAARSLVYEDCRRDIDVSFGPELLARLGPPLTLLLQSARWLTCEVARRVERKLAALHARICSQTRSETVPSYPFFVQAASGLLGRQRDASFVDAERELHLRWARVLDIETACAQQIVHLRLVDLTARAEQAFGNADPPWSLVRYFSPDLLLQAADEAALRRGDFQAVLGEIHASNTLAWSCFFSQHPAPGELLEAMARDLDQQLVVLPQMPKSWNQRVNISLVLPQFYRFEINEQPPAWPPCRTLPAGEVVIVQREGRLEARNRDATVRFPAIELFGLYLTQECSRILGQLLPAAPHRPRLAIDDLVIARERWCFAGEDLGFADLKDPAERFLAIRRWARRHRLPRFTFYKLPAERKPLFLDLESPIYVDIFARLLRKADTPAGEPRLVVTEMLPDFQHLWLTDGRDQAFTSELRLAALQA